jgi:hypothetical protein
MSRSMGRSTGIEPGALALQHAGQIDAHRTNGCKQNEGVDGKLQPAVGGHVELLREEQGEGQVAEQQDGQISAMTVMTSICMGLPQLLAGLDVEKRQGEENYGEQQHDCILHQ